MWGMFKAIESFEEAAGKTILHIREFADDQWIVAFTDGTYIRFGIEFEYYGERSTVTLEKLHEHELCTEEGLSAGLVTRDEIDAYKRRHAEEERQRLAERMRRDEENERRVYEALKAKYELQR